MVTLNKIQKCGCLHRVEPCVCVSLLVIDTGSTNTLTGPGSRGRTWGVCECVTDWGVTVTETLSLRGGGPSRPPFCRTLKESCKGLVSVSLKNKHSTHTVFVSLFHVIDTSVRDLQQVGIFKVVELCKF